MTNAADFHALLKEIGDLHDLKNKDYGRETDPYANVRGSQDWGIAPWVGAMVRATDKVKRLQKVAQGGTLANEGVEDSLLDLAVYTLIALALWREWTKTPAHPLTGEPVAWPVPIADDPARK